MVFQSVFFALAMSCSLLLCGATDDAPEEGGLNFLEAINAVNTEKQNTDNINYGTFCEDTVDKPAQPLLGCHLKAPNHGFELRVCKLETGCEELINSSLSIHDSIFEAQLNVVKYSQEDMVDLKCKDEHPPKTTCIGYMEQWIESGSANLVEFNVNVFNETEDDMISEIKAYQETPEAKAKTVTDLQKIIDWMTPEEGKCTLYKQLCDLEGFFKKTGGFVIHNPSVEYKMTLSDTCQNDEDGPTNERVLAVLKKFIKELSPATPTKKSTKKSKKI